jgi:hypothetical protein
MTADGEMAFALARVTAETTRDTWNYTGINPAIGDFTVGACGRYLKPLKKSP